MLIAALQMEPVPGNYAANLETIGQAAETAASAGAVLLLTPELSLSGYAAATRNPALAQPRDGAAVRALAALAERHNIAIAAGFPEALAGRVYNTAVVVKPDGGRHFYRKCHLYGPCERAAFAVSNVPPEVFTLGNITAGMLICYDVEFPEMVRGLALQGAKLILVPTALPAGASSRQVSSVIVPARALENQLFVAYADLCGNEDDFAYEGRSVIAAPDGDFLARAGQQETLLFARIYPGAYAVTDAETPYLADRRPDIYEALQAGSLK